MITHLVLNPNARHLGDGSRLQRVLREAAAEPGHAPMHVICTRSFEELDEAARRVAGEGSDAVVLAGGDGSYGAGLSALARAFGTRPLPPIAFAPGGTVSTVAKNWGMKGDAVRSARAIVRAVRGERAPATVRPSMRVRDAEGRERLGFIFGTGLVASFFDVYYASPEQGTRAAARIAARTFVGSFTGGELARRILAPIPCRITVDGHEQPAKAYGLVVASVVRDLGLHMQVTYRAGTDATRVHLVASPLAASRLGPQMPLVLAGRRMLGRDHVDVLAAKARIDFTTERCPYVVDGDQFAAAWVEVEPGPTFCQLTAA